MAIHESMIIPEESSNGFRFPLSTRVSGTAHRVLSSIGIPFPVSISGGVRKRNSSSPSSFHSIIVPSSVGPLNRGALKRELARVGQSVVDAFPGKKVKFRVGNPTMAELASMVPTKRDGQLDLRGKKLVPGNFFVLRFVHPSDMG